MGVEVQGLEQLMNALSALSNPDFADQTLRKGLAQAGKMVQGTAKKLCPVDTGQLRNSIEVTQVENGVDIGTNVEYAPYVEYGTGKKGDPSVEHVTEKKSKKGRLYPFMGQSPQPFLYPALKAVEPQILPIVKNVLQSEINRVVK